MIYVDTSAFYAFLSAADQDHQGAKRAFQEILGGNDRLVATSYVVGETMGLVQYRLGLAVLRRFADDMLPLVHVRWVGPGEQAAAWALLRQVNKRSFTIVDASSAALMQRDGAERILAFDPEFGRLGFSMLPGTNPPGRRKA